MCDFLLPLDLANPYLFRPNPYLFNLSDIRATFNHILKTVQKCNLVTIYGDETRQDPTSQPSDATLNQLLELLYYNYDLEGI